MMVVIVKNSIINRIQTIKGVVVRLFGKSKISLIDQMSVITMDKVEIWQDKKMLFDNYRGVFGRYFHDFDAELKKHGDNTVLSVECEYDSCEGWAYITIEIDKPN